MKKWKFNNKLLLTGGLLLTAVAIPTIAVLTTSCSSSNVTSTSSWVLNHSYHPSSELESVFSLQQYDEMFSLLSTFDGSNKVVTADNVVYMKNNIAEIFTVNNNSIKLIISYEINSLTANIAYNLSLNSNATDANLFTMQETVIFGSQEIPNPPKDFSKQEFETWIKNFTVQGFNEMLASLNLHWVDN